ncbi:MAG: RecX family transcriptional regulator [Flavobacteriales bacterium]|nr:RecX family transcriptional regulator [Flavobacteriales bacterium]
MKKSYKNISYDRALEKALRYCAYQERSRKDVYDRLEAWQVSFSDRDKIVDYLIDLDYLNEKRFVESYIRGKFVFKKWGRNKIRMGLAQKGLKGSQVAQALEQEISDEAYREAIQDLMQKKMDSVHEEDPMKKRDKVYRYLLGKGFESDWIVEGFNLL